MIRGAMFGMVGAMALTFGTVVITPEKFVEQSVAPVQESIIPTVSREADTEDLAELPAAGSSADTSQSQEQAVPDSGAVQTSACPHTDGNHTPDCPNWDGCQGCGYTDGSHTQDCPYWVGGHGGSGSSGSSSGNGGGYGGHHGGGHHGGGHHGW